MPASLVVTLSVDAGDVFAAQSQTRLYINRYLDMTMKVYNNTPVDNTNVLANLVVPEFIKYKSSSHALRIKIKLRFSHEKTE